MRTKKRFIIEISGLVLAIILGIIHFQYWGNLSSLYSGFKGFFFILGTFLVIIIGANTGASYVNKKNQ